jgi:membrane protease YdiL (CAAX protease family)
MDRPSAEAERRRRLLEIALFLAGFLAAWTTRATALYPVDEAIASDAWRAAYSNLLKLAMWVLPAVAFARWVRRASPATYLGLAVFPAHRQWLLCLAVTAIYLSGVSAFETMLGGKSLLPLSSLAVVGTFSIAVSSVLEEILFRGLVLRELREVLQAGSANVLASLLFVGVHLPHWLWRGDPGGALLTSVAGVFALSLFLGWLYFRSGSIWPPAGAHAAYNLLVQLLAGRST